jgi:hypothetical protein
MKATITTTTTTTTTIIVIKNNNNHNDFRLKTTRTVLAMVAWTTQKIVKKSLQTAAIALRYESINRIDAVLDRATLTEFAKHNRQNTMRIHRQEMCVLSIDDNRYFYIYNTNESNEILLIVPTNRTIIIFVDNIYR